MRGVAFSSHLLRELGRRAKPIVDLCLPTWPNKMSILIQIIIVVHAYIRHCHKIGLTHTGSPSTGVRTIRGMILTTKDVPR